MQVKLTTGINFINILRAAFLNNILMPKNWNPNCEQKKAANNTFESKSRFWNVNEIGCRRKNAILQQKLERSHNKSLLFTISSSKILHAMTSLRGQPTNCKAEFRWRQITVEPRQVCPLNPWTSCPQLRRQFLVTRLPTFFKNKTQKASLFKNFIFGQYLFLV